VKLLTLCSCEQQSTRSTTVAESATVSARICV